MSDATPYEPKPGRGRYAVVNFKYERMRFPTKKGARIAARKYWGRDARVGRSRRVKGPIPMPKLTAKPGRPVRAR